ncbi:MAG: FliH/SctL family protein [bacterium]
MDRTNKEKYVNQMEQNNLYCFPELSIKEYNEFLNEKGEKYKNNDSGNFIRNIAEKNKNENVNNIYGDVNGNLNSGDKKNNFNFDQGYIDGEKAGIEAGKKKIEPVLKNFSEALNALNEVKRKLYINAEKETVKLALAIAKKVIAQEISTDKEIIINIIRQALKNIPGNDKIKIRLSSSDLKTVLKNTSQLENVLKKYQDSIFFEDENIETGGCIIETKNGDFDARIEKQINMIEKAFDEEFKNSVERF